jgi:2-aminoadipate transaminase
VNSALSALGERTAPPPISWLMEIALSRPGLISLAAGFTDNATLPVVETRALLTRLLSARRSAEPALQYGSTAGLPELRQRTAERIRGLDAAPSNDPRYSPDRVLIGHGSQQLLYLVTEILCNPGDIVLVEDPTYFVYLSILQSHGVRCRGIKLEHDGLDLANLQRVLTDLEQRGELPRVKLLYLLSYYQNPTGVTTSLAKKAGALALLRRFERAAGHRLYLLEDAAYREMRFAGDDVPSALTLPGARERVIHLGTYSKPFATGVRVGFGFLPPTLLGPATRVKGNHDFGTSSLLQHLLARALASSEYSDHLATLPRRYARKARGLVRAIRRHLPPSIEWQEPLGGMYIWARLPGIRTGLKSALFKRALEAGVLYVPGSLCYGADPNRPIPDDELRLSFGNASPADIEEGIRRLGEALR